MPQIFVNNTVSPYSFENLRNFSELIPSVKERHLEENSYLYEIQVNGIKITPENKLTFNERSIDEEDSINFIFIQKYDLLHEIIETCPNYIDHIITKINIAVELLKAEEYDYSNRCLEQTIEKLDLFIQLTSHLHQSMKISSDLKLQTGWTLKELQIHLLSIVKAIHQAKTTNDHIMLADLLEYELKDNLTRWKITVIPLIKQLSTI